MRWNTFIRIATAFALVLVVATEAVAKPTREDIVDYIKDCVDRHSPVDVVGQFGVDFTGLDLSGIDTRSANVRIETNLDSADFSGSRLDKAIINARARNAKFIGADLTETHFYGDLSGAVFDRAILVKTEFSQCQMVGVKLAGADLTSATISASNFSNADLADTKWTGAACYWYGPRYDGANLERADMRGLTLIVRSSFRQANMRGAKLQNGSFIEADFTGADLTGAEFDGADINAAIFGPHPEIDPAALGELTRRAARWRHDLAEWLKVLGVLGFGLLALLSPIIGLVLGLWLRIRGATSWVRSMGGLAIPANLLAVVGIGSLVLMAVCGGSRVAQMDGGGFFGWSFWFRWYPVMMAILSLGSIAACAVALVFLGLAIRDRSRFGKAFLCWLFTAANFVCEWLLMMPFFPTA